MDSLLGLLCSAAVVLAIIAVVGHGLWLAIAWLIGALGPSDAEQVRKPRKYCPACGDILFDDPRKCTRCGWQAPSPINAPAKPGLDALLRKLTRLHQLGEIDAPTVARLRAAIQAEQAGSIAVPAPPAEELKVASAAAEPLPSVPAEAIVAEVVRDAIPVESELEVVRRAEQYALQRAGATTHEPVAPPAPEPPARDWSQLLTHFMEEKNIRWGELVGGLLIVCCSIALVISFWSQIAERPLLKFFLFNGVTAGLFGLGFYTHRRWKLRTTSQGLLIIATLLVPLNFLAIAAFSEGAAPASILMIGGELISIALFSALVYLAAMIAVPRAPLALALGVVGSAVSQLLVRRFIFTESSLWELYALAAVPLACYLGSVGTTLVRTRRWTEWGEPEANELFELLGMTTFAAALPLGLLLVRSGAPYPTLTHLAPFASLFGMPALAAGLLLMLRLDRTRLAALRTAGTSVAVMGAALLVAGLFLAWTDPTNLILVAAIDFVAFSAIAFAMEIPQAQLPAIAALVPAYLAAFHAALGHIGWREVGRNEMTHAILSAASGTALVPLAAVVGGGAWLLLRSDRRAAQGRWYALAAVGIAMLSLVAVVAFGFGRQADAGTSWVLLLYAVAALVVGARLHPAIVWIGSALLLGAFIQALVFRYPEQLGLAHPWLIAMLAHSSVMALAAGVRRSRGSPTEQELIPWQASALATSAVAVAMLAALMRYIPLEQSAGYTYWLAADWLVLAWFMASPILFMAFQAALSVAVALSAASWSDTPSWLDPRRIQWQGIALGVLNGAWIAVRLATRRVARLQSLLAPLWPTVDQLLTGVLVVALLTLAWYGAAPGVSHELTPRSQVIDVDEPAWLGIPGISTERALEPGSWIWLGVLLLVLVAGQWERFRPIAILATMLVLWAGCPLVAGRFPTAAASMLRWELAGFGLVLSLPIWFRNQVFRAACRLHWPAMESRSANLDRLSRIFLLIVAVLPVLALTLKPALAAIAGQPLLGPARDSFFGRVGHSTAFLVPLALVCVTLVGHAIRERSPSYAFAGGLVLNLGASLGYVLSIITQGYTFGDVELLRLAQFNVLASGGYALAWLAATEWWRRSRNVDEPEPRAAILFAVQCCLGIAILALLLGPGVFRLAARPLAAADLGVLGGAWGWSSGLVAFAALVWFGSRFAPAEPSELRTGDLLAAGTLTAASLVAFEACRFDTGNWLAYHVLLVTCLLTDWSMLVGDVWVHKTGRQRTALPWTGLVAVFVFVLAIRSWRGDLQRPWWAIGGLAALVPVAIGWACLAARRRLLFVAAALVNLAISMWWIERPLWHPNPASFAASSIGLFQINVIALALPTLAWLTIELRWLRPRMDHTSKPPAVHSLTATLSLATLASVVAVLLAAHLDGAPLSTGPLLGWLSIGAVAVAIGACLWDAQAGWPWLGLYLLGIVLLGNVVEGYDLAPRWLLWTGMMLLAAYSLATSYLWSVRQGLRAIGDRLGIPRRSGPPFADLNWLVPANWLLAVAVMVSAFWVELTFVEQPIRIISGQAAIIQALAVGLLARGRRRTELRFASLGFAVLGAVAFGWAFLGPAASVLDRAVVVTVVLAVMTVLYGSAVKLLPASAWTQSARRMVPVMLVVGTLSLGFILATELHEYIKYEAVAMGWQSITAVAVALLLVAAASLAAALIPGRDPLRLSERGRTVYVYAAEALLALLFLHVRLTMPWLFTGFFLRYWPLVVMAIAFAGIGLAELFRRERRLVLAEPLERTGVLMPLLPVLGYWVGPPTGVHYSLQLLGVGMLYAVLSVMRRSFGFGLLAALAANGGLWFFLDEQGYGVLLHPQLWLIPPALCVLVAAYWNRDRLDDTQMTAIRYLTAITIYVSSTAEIFINGVAQEPLLPFVLAGFSLLGIVAGIMLQVRAFLFLGTSFLVLSLFTMIWHAAVDLEMTWLWAVSGIVTGVLIIAVFAAFEKKRDDVLRFLERFREWEV